MRRLVIPGLVSGHLALARIRGEHDRWAADAKLGRHYTIAPTSLWVESIGPAIHSYFDFVKQGSGMYKGQLITERGRSSWSLWQEFGPFTPIRQFTAADARAADAKAMPGEMARAQREVAAAAGWDTAWATAQRDYPETVRALQPA